ncbi:MAG: GNAT family N-acetyltransferase [Candidatus Absconditicoccaceae bacterium]
MIYDITKTIEEKTSQFTIRKVRFEDMETLCDIHKRCRKENFKGIVDQEYLDHFGRNPKIRWSFIVGKKDTEYCLFVYETWGKIVGFIEGGSSNKEDFDFEVYGFYVDPQKQKGGIGNRLFDYFTNYQNVQGRRNFYLRTFKDNIAWVNFYKKFGGKVTEEKKRRLGNREYDLVCSTRKK